MYTVKVYERVGAAWQEISGIVDTPVSYGDYLDERLDEGYLTVYKSAKPLFHPDTEIRIDMTDGTETTRKFFIVSSDEVEEIPAGSGTYKHSISLIERTKRLEGIVCQSLTFTNAITQAYSVIKVLPSDNSPAETSTTYVHLRYFSENQKTLSTPIDAVKVFNAPAISEIGSAFLEYERGLGKAFNLIWDPLFKEPASVSINGTKYLCKSDSDLYKSIAQLTPPLPRNITILYRIYAGTLDQSEMVYTELRYDIASTEDLNIPKKKTILDVCNRILLLAEPLRGAENPRYQIDPAQEKYLDSIMAPEFTMTQCTLREQLRIVGGYIHAEPRLMDPVVNDDGTETGGNYIHFDLFGDTDIQAVRSDYDAEQRIQQITEYCTELDTTAANLVNALSGGTIGEPDGRNRKSLRTESVNVMITENNGIIQTQFPIRDIAKLEVSYNGQMWDITPYVYEQAQYSANLSSYLSSYPYSKAYAVYYTQNEKNIRGLFFKVDNAISPIFEQYSIVNIVSAVSGDTPDTVRSLFSNSGYPSMQFSVTYTPIYSSRFSAGKQYVDGREHYTRIYNQSENLIESLYYGENVKGAAERMGNPEITRTYRYKNVSAIPKVGKMAKIGDEWYMVSTVRTEVMKDFVRATVEYTKDFNRLSQYVGISSTKRVYEVSEKEAYRRAVLIRDYFMIGHGGNDIITDDRLYVRSCIPIVAAFFPPAVEPTSGRYPGTHPITAVNAYGTKTGTPNDKYGNVILPVVTSVFGNSIVFSWEYKDNYSAGEKSVMLTNANGEATWWQQDVPYCDFFGRIPYYYMKLLPRDIVPNIDRDGNDATQSAYSFPETNAVIPDNTAMTISPRSARYYRMEKDSRETITMNFQVDFRTDSPNIVIGPGIARLCSWVHEPDTSLWANIFLLENPLNKFAKTYMVLDENGNPVDSSHTMNEATYSYKEGYSPATSPYVAITLPVAINTAKAWVISYPATKVVTETESGEQTTYEGGDILLSCPDNAALRREFGIADTDKTTPFTFYIYPTRDPRPYGT
jgi:hypothetical protein